MRITLKASDVAAIIGRHRYKPRQEVFDELWKKYSSDTFKGKTKKDKAYEALSFSSEAQKVLEKSVEIKAKDSEEVQKIFSQAKDLINFDSKLSDSQKSEVIDHLRSKIYTTHGTRKEDTTSDVVEVTEKVTLLRDNKFYTIDICEIGEHNFVVCGKVDRIEEKEDGSKVLVEIKNRTNRLFKQVVEYEMIQVQVYLQMLGLIHARLVEQYNNQVLSHPITRDEEMWTNEILPELEKFCEELSKQIA
jgi:PD-(D/E)XK nuclease superfamily